MESYRLVPRISREDLDARMTELAGRINRDYAGREILVVGVLKGSYIFIADLTRKITVPLEVDFVRLSSYGSKSETCGEVRITKDVELPVRGRDILVVEDIVDTGLTLRWYLEHLRRFNPRSISVCALVDKIERRQVQIPLDYIGLRIEKGFLVGYGLDYSEKHRNLPGIFEVRFNE